MRLLFGVLLLLSSCEAFAQWQSSGKSLSGIGSGSSGRSMSSDDECIKTKEILSLDSIRSTLIRQEETIIFALIERAQFHQNNIIYEKGGFPNLGTPAGVRETDEELSFLKFMLLGTEALHCGVRRYTSPEENAFFPHQLPPGPLEALPDLDYPVILSENAAKVNFNPILLKKYIQKIVPSISKPGDDEQYGSSCLADVILLQALSKRVHYGKFVAESKYRANPEAYQKLVDQNDADGVMDLLTNSEVERLVLRRARLKAATYGREPLLTASFQIEEISSEKTSLVAAAAASAVVAAVEAMEENGDRGKVDPAVIESVYRDIIIPLTKDIEVAYLFQRCGKDPPPQFAPDRMSTDV